MNSPPGTGVSNGAIVETYDRLAAPYDWVIAPLETKTRRRAVDLLSIEAGEHVLEIGCGPGHALVALARRVGPTGHVVGVDAAPAMVRRADRRTDRTGTSDRIDLLRGDARSLPVSDDAIDVVLVEDTLELFSPGELVTVLGEGARVLDTDGRLGVVTMERAGAEDDPFVRAYDWAFDHIPGYNRVGCRPIYARRTLEENGFDIERQEQHRRGYVWPVEILIARPR